MKKFTFDDYKQALDGAGPKLMEIILERAAEDRNISLGEYCLLFDLVEMMEGIC